MKPLFLVAALLVLLTACGNPYFETDKAKQCAQWLCEQKGKSGTENYGLVLGAIGQEEQKYVFDLCGITPISDFGNKQIVATSQDDFISWCDAEWEKRFGARDGSGADGRSRLDVADAQLVGVRRSEFPIDHCASHPEDRERCECDEVECHYGNGFDGVLRVRFIPKAVLPDWVCSQDSKFVDMNGSTSKIPLIKKVCTHAVPKVKQ